MKNYILTVIAFLMFIPLLSAATEGEKILVEGAFLDGAMEAILVIFGLIATYFGQGIKAQALKRGMDEELFDELSTQVSKLYHDTVRDFKAAAKDGKITSEEAKGFRRQAFDNTKAALSSKRLIKRIGVLGRDKISGWIEDVITAKKAK